VVLKIESYVLPNRSDPLANEKSRGKGKGKDATVKDYLYVKKKVRISVAASKALSMQGKQSLYQVNV